MKFAMLDNYKGFINIVFGILLTVIGYLLVDKLGQIDNSLQRLTELQQNQLVKNENFELRIALLEQQLKLHKNDEQNKE